MLRLNGPVRAAHLIDPDDVLSVKRAHFRAPRNRSLGGAARNPGLRRCGGTKPGLRCAPPRLRGVEAFQRTHGPAVDRVMEPGGETERTLDRVITPLIRAHGLPGARAERQDRPMLQPAQQPGGSVPLPAFAPEREQAPGPTVQRPALILGRVGGGAALERLPDAGAAIALADLMFRRGGAGAARMLIPELYEIYVDLVSVPTMRSQLADELAQERSSQWPAEADRNAHMDSWLRGRLN